MAVYRIKRSDSDFDSQVDPRAVRANNRYISYELSDWSDVLYRFVASELKDPI